jgi:hypothetical protein
MMKSTVYCIYKIYCGKGGDGRETLLIVGRSGKAYLRKVKFENKAKRSIRARGSHACVWA